MIQYIDIFNNAFQTKYLKANTFLTTHFKQTKDIFLIL